MNQSLKSLFVRFLCLGIIGISLNAHALYTDRLEVPEFDWSEGLEELNPELTLYYQEATDYYSPELYSCSASHNNDQKQMIRDHISKAHIKVPGQADQLVDSCREAQAGQECFEHKSLSYKTARKWLFGHLHLNQAETGELSVLDVYCGHSYTAQDFNTGDKTPGLNEIPWHEVVNTEHTWPQSRFNKEKYGKDIQKGDLHHLFPTANRMNSTRGNLQFAEVDVTSSSQVTVRGLDCEMNRKGTIKAIEGMPELTAGDRNLYYEPPSAHKGNVARALFYFSVRYEMPIAPAEEAYLRKWHEEDPVDYDEALRNQLIFQIQGNRNPFIDFPHLVDVVDDF